MTKAGTPGNSPYNMHELFAIFRRAFILAERGVEQPPRAPRLMD
jgi:hypothetical protein